MSTTAPTIPGTFTAVTTAQTINGTSTADSYFRVFCKVAAGSSETVTGFTSANNIAVAIYRNTKPAVTTCADIAETAQLTTTAINTTTTTVTYASATFQDAASWGIGFAYTPAATAGLGTAPSGMTNRDLSGSTKLAVHDTNGAVSSFTTANVTTTTASRVMTAVFGLKAPVVSTPTFSADTGAAQSVTISESTSGAAVCYTDDGSTPAATTAGTCSTGTTYSAPVAITTTTTFKALGTLTALTNSAVGTQVYTISGGTDIAIIDKDVAQNDASATTLAAPAMNCTGANTIAIAVQGASSAGSSVADSSGNTYTEVTASLSANSGNLNWFVAPSATVTSSLVVTATYLGSTSFRRVMTWCLSNGAASPLDVAAAVNSGAGATDTATTAAVTPSAAGGIILAAVSNNDGATCTFTANNSFTQSFTPASFGGTAQWDTNAIEKLNSTGAQTPSMSQTATGGAWRMSAITLKK